MGIVTSVCSRMRGVSVRFHKISGANDWPMAVYVRCSTTSWCLACFWLMVLEYIHDYSFHVLCVLL
jgi:hypothetical protein